MKTLFWIITICCSTTLVAQTSTQRQAHFNTEKENLGVQGYDPVSYFNLDEPLKGEKDLEYVYEGITYRFANAQNRAAFQESPTKYEPAYGGWCGYAMAKDGSKVPINPTCYKIIDGRNVLFYKALWGNALTKWEKERAMSTEKELLQQGDDFWQKTLLVE